MLSKTTPARSGGKWPLITAWLGVVLPISAGALVGSSGPAYRAEMIALSTSFTWLRQGAQLAMAAAVFGLVTLILAGILRRWRPALEATATTPWFGFKDDVAIRMKPTEAGVLVDMRSASRLGKSDLGTNAERIQAFLEDLKKQ